MQLILSLLYYLSQDFYLILTTKVTHLTSSQEPENCFPSLQITSKRSVQSLFAEPNEKKVPGLSSICKNQAWALPWKFSVEQLLSDHSCPNEPWPLLFLKVEKLWKTVCPMIFHFKERSLQVDSSRASHAATCNRRQRVCTKSRQLCSAPAYVN